MFLEYIDEISDEFKQIVYNETKNEVEAIVDTTSLNESQKNALEMFFVQPLYYAKLHMFLNIDKIPSDFSIKNILENNNYSDTEKQLIINSLTDKLNIGQSGDMSIDANNVFNKIFFNSELFAPKLDELLKIDEVKHVSTGFDNSTFYSSQTMSKYATSKTNVLLMSGQACSVCEIENVTSNYPDFGDINIYNNEQTELFYPNVIEVCIDNYQIKEAKLTINPGQTVNVNGYILKIKSNKELQTKVSDKTELYIGNHYRDLTVTNLSNEKLDKVELSITYLNNINIVELNEKIDTAIGEFKDSFITHTFAPTLIDLYIDVKNSNYIDKLEKFTNDYFDYEEFIMEYAVANDILLQNGNYITESYAKLFISPYIYSKIDFNYNGLDYSKKIMSMFKNKKYLKIKIVELNVKQ